MRNQRVRTWLSAFSAVVIAAGLSACGDNADGEQPGGAGTGAFNAEQFFRGQSIDVVVNASPGGGIDTWTRLVMAKLADFVPGKPRFEVSNQTGVGGLGTVFDAPKNDLVLGTASKGSRLYAAQVEEQATHDIYKMQFIGGLGDDPRSMLVLGEPARAFNSFTDASGKDGPVFKFSEVVGDETGVVEGSYASSWLCDVLDLPCDMTPVADGGATVMMPMVQRNELNWIDSNTPSVVRSYTEFLVGGEGKIMAEYATSEFTKITTPKFERPDLANILPPEAKEEYDRILPVIGGGGLSAHIFAGPNFPTEAVKALGDAYVEMMKDPEILKQVVVAKAGDDPDLVYEPTPVGPEDARRLVIEQADKFFANEEYYAQKQKEYYDKYWK